MRLGVRGLMCLLLLPSLAGAVYERRGDGLRLVPDELPVSDPCSSDELVVERVSDWVICDILQAQRGEGINEGESGFCRKASIYTGKLSSCRHIHRLMVVELFSFSM